jgi:hypothetical protein
MATRSNIAIEKQDGTVSSIYCHFDGYVGGVGKRLFEHYQSKEKLQELIDLGDISFLRETIEETIAYHRDREEDYRKPSKYENVEEFFESFEQQYAYCLTKEGMYLVGKKSSNQVANLVEVLWGSNDF